MFNLKPTRELLTSNMFDMIQKVCWRRVRDQLTDDHRTVSEPLRQGDRDQDIFQHFACVCQLLHANLPTGDPISPPHQHTLCWFYMTNSGDSVYQCYVFISVYQCQFIIPKLKLIVNQSGVRRLSMVANIRIRYEDQHDPSSLSARYITHYIRPHGSKSVSQKKLLHGQVLSYKDVLSTEM